MLGRLLYTFWSPATVPSSPHRHAQWHRSDGGHMGIQPAHQLLEKIRQCGRMCQPPRYWIHGDLHEVFVLLEMAFSDAFLQNFIFILTQTYTQLTSKQWEPVLSLGSRCWIFGFETNLLQRLRFQRVMINNILFIKDDNYLTSFTSKYIYMILYQYFEVHQIYITNTLGQA